MLGPSRPLPLPTTDGKLTVREWLALLLGAAMLTVLVVLVEPGTFGSTDWVRMHGFYKAYCQSSVAAGRLPLWNPFHWLGRPFLADIETAFFYPPEWLYLLLDVHLACVLTCALHYLLLLYGTVKLARALGAAPLPSFFSAFVFAASAPIVGAFTSGLVHYAQALCLAPLILYLGMRVQAGPRRRDVALLGLALGLQILCGHPQAAWLTQVGLAVFLLGRRLEGPWRSSLVALGIDAGMVAVASALGLALAGVALLPLAELARQGNRPEASLAFASVFSEPAYGWASLLVPIQRPYFAFQTNAQLYAGLLPLIAGICGLVRLRERNVRALFLLAVFAALLAAGDATPAFRVFFHVIPGVGWLRIHCRATVLVTLAFVLAAGLFFSQHHSRRSVLAVAGTALGVGLVAVVFCLLWPGFASIAAVAAVGRALVATLAGLLLVLWTRQKDGGARWPVWAIALLTTADLGLAVHYLKQDNRATDLSAFEGKLRDVLDAQTLLAPRKAPPRVFLPGPCENAGMTFGWSAAQGYSALAPGRVWRHLHGAVGVEPPFANNTFPSTELSAFGPFPYRSMGLVIGVDPRNEQVVYNPRPDPRAYLVGQVLQVRDDVEATALMRQGHDFHSVALVEQPVSLPGAPLDPSARATITDFAPERVVIAVESQSPALLVLAEPWFPGWSASVNGVAAPCLPANAWMRAVAIPEGKSEVVFVFRSTYLARGAAVSLLGLVAIAGLLARSRRSFKSAPPQKVHMPS
jgi:hypothetical protein